MDIYLSSSNPWGHYILKWIFSEIFKRLKLQFIKPYFVLK